ncbi:hypothetical protein ACH4S9_17140 [Streptomyces sp. NPDC021225]|uniref:hypothetical protein n=1 Tax=Streptomyces sp. NPDC021225 TaxID=3365121 RepID=UPI00378BE528
MPEVAVSGSAGRRPDVLVRPTADGRRSGGQVTRGEQYGARDVVGAARTRSWPTPRPSANSTARYSSVRDLGYPEELEPLVHCAHNLDGWEKSWGVSFEELNREAIEAVKQFLNRRPTAEN